jgi:predicted  nucleic acid-binding Zn-ribbon protein
LNVKDQVLWMVRIQELALAIQEATGVVESAPRRIEEVEQRFRERNAAYVEVKERCEALQADQRHRSGELAVLEEHRKKYAQDMMQVQNQREYAAMLKEIDSVKARIAEHEEAILKDMEEFEAAKAELALQEAHIQSEHQRVADERAEVERSSERAQQEIVTRRQERERIETELPASLVAMMRRVESGRAGLFLSKAVDGICQSCYVRVRPQVFQEIKLLLRIHTCGNCKRLLYHPEPSSRTEAAPAANDDAATASKRAMGDAGPVEAVNGGAL